VRRRVSDRVPVLQDLPSQPDSHHDDHCNCRSTQEDISIDRLQKSAAKYLHANVIEITNANLNTFTG
jgi:hypothetical protein